MGEQRWKEKWGGEEAEREKAIEKVPPKLGDKTAQLLTWKMKTYSPISSSKMTVSFYAPFPEMLPSSAAKKLSFE